VHLATQNQAESLTGLQVGGISPLALLNRGFQVVLDESACSLDHLYISGGQRGLDIRLGWEDLVELTGAVTAAITR
jgi:Cys-tRNA(Pro)/Cys-tRNA(Cys) deacylase